MKHRLTYVSLAMMGIGALSAPILARFGYEVLAGAMFVTGMLVLWVGASATFLCRLWRPRDQDL